LSCAKLIVDYAISLEQQQLASQIEQQQLGMIFFLPESILKQFILAEYIAPRNLLRLVIFA
jgi:hypothetical protein